MLIRSSGVVAFSMLAVSTIWGLLLTTKVLGSWARAKPLTWFHESLAVGALLATIVHMVALSIHEYIDFAWADILVPGRSGWRPAAVAFGIVAFYGAALLSVSFYFKKFIGQTAWRAIHFASFGVFVSAATHGILAGTDTAEPWMMGVYVGATACVVLLLTVRLAQQYASTGASRPTPRRNVERGPSRRSAGGQGEPDGHHGTAESAAGPDSKVPSGRFG